MPSSGEYVWATDDRYTGANALSATGAVDAGTLGKSGLSTQSASGKQVVSLNSKVSTMGSAGGMTCYKAACDSGYYLDEPNSTYFTSSNQTGTVGLTCYKATGCKSGYYNGGSSHDYHGYKCSECTYSCPSGYSTSTTSCSSGYALKTSSATTQGGCPSKTCGKCEKDEYCACSYTIWPEKVSRGSYFDIYYWAEIKCTRDIRDHEEIIIELSQIDQSGGIDCGTQSSATIYLPTGNMKAQALTKFKEGMGCYVNDSNMRVYVTPPKTFRADNITCTWE